MRVSTMRAVDYWVGVPLCFCTSVIDKIAKALALFDPSKKTRVPPRKVLFIELSEMGSTILVDPAMQKLRRELGVELHFLIFQSCRESLELLSTIPEQNIRVIRDRNLLLLAWDTLAFFLWARRRQIDTVIDLELFSRFTALLTYYSGARNRVGFYSFHHEGLYRGNLLTHRVSYNPHIHIAKNFIALVYALISKARTQRGEVPYSKTLIGDEEIRVSKVRFDETKKATMRARIADAVGLSVQSDQRVVLVNANASDLLPQRRWMPEHYISVIKKVISDHPDVLVLLTGAPSEAKGLDFIAKGVGHSRCVNFAGRVRLSELPLLYSVSTLLLTNDSGPAHFASVTEIPTYVLFGPETPQLYGSLGNFTAIYAGLACSPCVAATNHRKTPCKDNVCLQIIRPEQVYGVLKPLLSHH